MTDHCSLCWLQSKKQLPPRLLRYSLLLQSFEFKITYKSGKLHKDADCLSRYINDTNEEKNEDVEEKEDDIFFKFSCAVAK